MWRHGGHVGGTLTKECLLASIVLGTNMAAILCIESPWIDCKPSISKTLIARIVFVQWRDPFPQRQRRDRNLINKRHFAVRRGWTYISSNMEATAAIETAEMLAVKAAEAIAERVAGNTVTKLQRVPWVSIRTRLELFGRISRATLTWSSCWNLEQALANMTKN